MANVIKTVYTYQLDGTTKDFNIPFEYLARKFVQVTLIGVDRKQLVLNQDYRFATRTVISMTQAWGPAQGYQQVEIRRFTSATERLVDFTDGSILRAYDLNVAQVQTLHVAEEARDLTADTIGVNNDGHLDARGRRIVNLANAVDAQDAVPFGQLKTMNQNSWQARNEAQTFKDQAKGFRDEAEVSRNAAEAAKARAGASELKAKDWATKDNTPVEGDLYSAKHYAQKTAEDRRQAGLARNAAQAAQAASETSAQNSKGSADLAKKWASNPKDQVVADNEYSAKHYAQNSSYYRTLSQNWATKAKGQVVEGGEYSAKHYALVAKDEAAKLGNWNLLASAVDKVEGGRVIWKYDQDSNIVRAYDGASLGWGWTGGAGKANPFVNFYLGKDYQLGQLSLHDNGLKWSGPKLQVFNVEAEIRGKTLRSLGNAQFDSTATINGTLRVASAGYIVKDNVQHGGGNNYQVNGMHYAIGGLTVDTYLYENRGSYHEYGYHLSGAGADNWFRHKSNGDVMFSSNRAGNFFLYWPGAEVAIAPDGNIKGAKWGGTWVSEYINQRAHDARRGPQQFTGKQNNVQYFEVPNGFITGFMNDTGDGNVRYSGWYFRVPMLWSQARGWFEFQNQ